MGDLKCLSLNKILISTKVLSCVVGCHYRQGEERKPADQSVKYRVSRESPA